MATKIISIGLTIGSLILAAVIIFDTPDAKPSDEKPTAFQIQNIESLKPAASLALPNSTENLAKKISEEIIARNPNGPEKIGGESRLSIAEPEKIIDELFNEALTNFDSQKIKPAIGNNEIVIIGQNDPVAIKTYLTDLQNILINNAPKLAGQNFDLSSVVSLVNAYEKTIAQLKKLPTPSSFASLHKEEISLLSAQKTIFETILNYQNDPVSALLAMQADQQIDQELAMLKEKFKSASN